MADFRCRAAGRRLSQPFECGAPGWGQFSHLLRAIARLRQLVRLLRPTLQANESSESARSRLAQAETLVPCLGADVLASRTNYGRSLYRIPNARRRRPVIRAGRPL